MSSAVIQQEMPANESSRLALIFVSLKNTAYIERPRIQETQQSQNHQQPRHKYPTRGVPLSKSGIAHSAFPFFGNRQLTVSPQFALTAAERQHEQPCAASQSPIRIMPQCPRNWRKQGRKAVLHPRATYWKHALSDFYELSRAEGPR
jgi:hypothetical protein